MQYWENRNTLKADSNVPAYILTIIKNKCINYLQHIQVREDASEHLKNHAMIEQFRSDGYKIVGEPRITGDGYYEGAVLDPDGNIVEVIA